MSIWVIMSSLFIKYNMSILSVIIPTYNRKQKTLEAIQSVIAQSFSDIEIIVVNDGSTDSTADFLRSQNLPIVLITKSNGGVSSARNAGIDRARGEYIAFLDSDDLWLEGKLKAQLEYFDQHSDISIVYTDQYINIDGNNLDQTRFERQAPKNKLALPAFVDFTPIHTSTVMLKKEVFERVGTFDESLQLHEDSEFWNRVSDRYEFGFIEKPLGIYRWESNAEHLTGTNQRQKFIEQGHRYLELYKQKKGRPLTSVEAQACLESEKILATMDSEIGT